MFIKLGQLNYIENNMTASVHTIWRERNGRRHGETYQPSTIFIKLESPFLKEKKKFNDKVVLYRISSLNKRVPDMRTWEGHAWRPGLVQDEDLQFWCSFVLFSNYITALLLRNIKPNATNKHVVIYIYLRKGLRKIYFWDE